MINRKKYSTVNIPRIVFGTSGLGNLYREMTDETKLRIVARCIALSKDIPFFDTAGKYGAGMALEVLGRSFKASNVAQSSVMISNKLGWLRTQLKTPEPTFEPGVWKGLRHDAIQRISHDGILECFEQGNELLNGYRAQVVSVHDPDEYLASAVTSDDVSRRYNDIIGAYEALEGLKIKGEVTAIGVGAKNWRTVRQLVNDVPLDWVMLAGSLTVRSHDPELLEFVRELGNRRIQIINAAVFHSGFLVGGDYFDYKLVSAANPGHYDLFRWRGNFHRICARFNIPPAAACVQFSLALPGVTGVALNVMDEHCIKDNLELPNVPIPDEFWRALKAERLITFSPDELNRVTPVNSEQDSEKQI
jgi:D-threo-aldose 1-dehydrogenase